MRITINAKVIEEGSFIINAQKFNQILKVMDREEITLTVGDNLAATIECGKSVHKMNALAGSDFPLVPKLESNQSFTISQKVLKNMLQKVSFAMAINDQRAVLNGCFCEIKDNKLMLVSCDTFKLAKCSVTTDIKNTGDEGTKIDFRFIIPVKTVNEITRMLSSDEDSVVKIVMTRKNMIFVFDDLIFFSRFVDGTYIDYDRVIVKNHKISLIADRDEVESALERAAIITEERIIGSVRSSVRLDIAGNVMKILAKSSAGSTYDEVDVEHEGDDLLIAFNNKYLTDSIRACSAEKIKISLSSALISINIEPAEKLENDAEELFMLLPVRMNN
jgi:DNA polymerase-3 subunit beta